ncbi:hypothetical protein ACFSJ2_14605 [Pseudochelatococcus lubricantis]
MTIYDECRMNGAGWRSDIREGGADAAVQVSGGSQSGAANATKQGGHMRCGGLRIWLSLSKQGSGLAFFL